MSKVLLYSGGMDSFIVAHMIPDAQLLYIDSGSRYTEKELSKLYLAPRQSNEDVDVIIDRETLNLSKTEREDAIVPARNLYLVTRAAEYGNIVLLASTAGDNSTDKDELFAEYASKVLSHIYNGAHYNRGDISIELPVKHLSKGQLVKWYIDNGFQIGALLSTVSCYASAEGQCGKCKACIRRWTALKTNDIDSAYIDDPRDYDWTDIIEQVYSGGWRCPDEDKYTMDILYKEGILL